MSQCRSQAFEIFWTELELFNFTVEPDLSQVSVKNPHPFNNAAVIFTAQLFLISIFGPQNHHSGRAHALRAKNCIGYGFESCRVRGCFTFNL